MTERKLDPAFKARREREMAAKIAERNALGQDRALMYVDIEHPPAIVPTPPATRAARQEGDEDEEEEEEKAGAGTGGEEFTDVAALGRVALSSETPIRRRGWFGPDWIEILDHGAGSVRLERVTRGLPMIAEHDRRRLAGKWTAGAVDSDRVLRAVPKFSRNGFAQEVQQDVLDGIRSTTSIGYQIYAAQLETVDENDGVETWRFTDWEPLEASWEVIPADLTVGVGRSVVATDPARNQPADTAKGAAVDEKIEAGPAGRTEGAPAPAPAKVPGVEEIRSQERTRATNLRNLGKAHRLEEARVEKWITEGTSFADAAREIVAEVAAKPPTPATAPAERNLLGLSEQDARRYSIRAAILQELNVRAPGQGEPAGFETEVSRALEKHIPGEAKRRGGILVPTGILQRAGQLDAATLEALKPLLLGMRLARQRELMTRAGLDTATSTKGVEAVFNEFQGFIELLRARAMVLQLGATYLPGLVGNAQFVKQTAAATAEWVAENPGSDQAITELALALVTLSPSTLMGSTYYTRQLLRQAAISIDGLVEADLVAIHARAIDRAAIHGSGSGDNQPEGAYVASGVNAVAFGGAISYAKVVEMETAIADADADVDGMAYLTTPGIRGAAKTTEKFSGDGTPIWSGSVREGEMNGYRAAASTQVRTDLGATPTPADHGLLFGAWPELLVGEWGMLELVVDPYSGKKQGIIEVTSFQMADVKFRHAEAFAKATGLTL